MSPRTRQQTRALHAYERVARVPEEEREDYKIQVNTLGSAVLRNGLAAAMAFLERDRASGTKAAERLLEDLADAGLLGVPAHVKGRGLPQEVRRLGMSDYMLATRELLQVLVWFRRAVQATFTKKGQGHVAVGGR